MILLFAKASSLFLASLSNSHHVLYFCRLVPIRQPKERWRSFASIKGRVLGDGKTSEKRIPQRLEK